MTETIIDGNTFNIVVEGRGDAPAIVLAHSLGTNLHVFDRQVAALAPHFRLVRFDARGHGGSRTSQGPYSIAQLGQDVLSVLDALGIEKAHFIGLSAGGLVGLWLLNNAPERFERAVLANVAAQIGSSGFWDERIRGVTENGIAALAPNISENWFTRQFRERNAGEAQRFEDTLAAMSAEGYAATAAAVRDADFREALGNIGRPVLVIVGRHDPVTPPGVGALVASAIPGAKTVTLEAAHLSPVEAAEAFNDAVLDFLQVEAALPPVLSPKPRKPRVPKPKPVPQMPSESEIEPKAEAAPPPIVVARSARKVTTKKAVAKKAAVKKPARKAAAKKRPVKKAATKKSPRKIAAKKRVARKSGVGKSAVRKSVTKKSVTKKRLVKKTTKKSVRKPAVRKSVRKVAKRALKKTAGRKPVRKGSGGRLRRR